MLLQSYAGFIEIMPAVPDTWKDISFNQLRAEGAYLVSAQKQNGVITQVKIVAEKGGKTKLKLPFSNWKVLSSKGVQVSQSGDFLELTASAGGAIVIGRK